MAFQIRKTIYYDIFFDEEDEQKAVEAIEALNQKGFEEVCARVETKPDGTKWVASCDSTGRESPSLCAQVVKIFPPIKSNKIPR